MRSLLLEREGEKQKGETTSEENDSKSLWIAKRMIELSYTYCTYPPSPNHAAGHQNLFDFYVLSAVITPTDSAPSKTD